MIQLTYHRTSEEIPPLTLSKPAGAAMDLLAAESATVLPNSWQRVRTGISLEIPEGMEAQIRTCHHLAEDRGLVVLNSPGTVSAECTSELYVLVENRNCDSTIHIQPGEQIALLVMCPVFNVLPVGTATFEVVEVE